MSNHPYFQFLSVLKENLKRVLRRGLEHPTLRYWAVRHASFALDVSNSKSTQSENISFIKEFFRLGSTGFLISLFGLLFLLASDSLVRFLIERIHSFFMSGIMAFTGRDVATQLTDFISIKNVDYLADVVGIGAGVLGVILGLFYTAFLTIVTTRYSNSRSSISHHLLSHQTINRYFVALSTLTSLALLVQLALSLGYVPTIISALLFTTVVIFALNTFIKYGKYALIFFDTSNLTQALIKENYRWVTHLTTKKKYEERLKKGRIPLTRILENLQDIRDIIEESGGTGARNTSFDKISIQLLRFSQYYNAVKHRIPSNEEWHVQKLKFKNWEDAKSMDFSLLQSTGVDMMAEKIPDYNKIERTIIDAQFELFELHIKGAEQDWSILLQQANYLQHVSLQCEFEIVEHYLTSLNRLIAQKLKASAHLQQNYRLQLVSVYAHHVVALAVGYNLFLSSLDLERVKAMAETVNSNRSLDEFSAFPYFLKRKIDDYHSRLLTEEVIEGKSITPLHYTEYEVVRALQQGISEYWPKMVAFCNELNNSLSLELVESDLQVEALYLSMSLLEWSQKVETFTHSLSEKTIQLNDLNFQRRDAEFKYDTTDVLEINKKFKDQLIKVIWDSGIEAFSKVDDNSPDIKGKFYQLILDDMVERILNPEFDSAGTAAYLRKYLVFSLLYIEHVRVKYRAEGNSSVLASRLFPLIVDLYEVCALGIIVDKIHSKNRVIDCIIDSWNRAFKEVESELNAWTLFTSIHDWQRSSFRVFANPSYIKEHHRQRKLEAYLIATKVARKEQLKHGGLSFVEHYVTDIEDCYVMALVKSMHMGTIDLIKLDEVFIEFFLRTRVVLKDLDIKTTRYGKELERCMAKED